MQLLRAQVTRAAANSVRTTSNVGTSSSRVTPSWTRPVAPARRTLHRFTTQASPEKETAIAESSPEAALDFRPFDEVKDELAHVEEAALTSSKIEDSFARVGYSRECEVAVNEQINIEYNMSYVYHAMSSYFARDNVALPGFATYFRESSLEEREHAQQLMNFQATRGGRTKLAHITMPLSDYNHPEKGDALHAMELALSLEKLNFHKLRELHAVADKNEDAQMADFVEAMLEEQVKGTKEVADYVAQLRRVGKGLGVFEFDRQLAADAKALTQTLTMPV